MAVRQLILRTEARHDYIRSELPDHPNYIGQNLVMIPDPHAFFSRLRKPEIDSS